MDDGLARVGGPGFFEWRGKAYRFAPHDTIAVIKGMTAWLIADYREELKRQSKDGELTAEDYQTELQAFRDMVAAKKFSYGSPIYVNSYATAVGMKQLMLLMIRQFQPEATTELVDAIAADAEACPRILRTMELLKSEEADPNPKGPTVP